MGLEGRAPCQCRWLIPQQTKADDEDKKLKIIAEKTESKTAKKPGRQVFSEVMDMIERGEAQGILVWHPNRLSRNARDTGWVIDLMDQGKLIEVVTPSQVFRNTPNDKFLLNLLCSQAKLENDNKGEDVKRGLKKKASMGLYPNHTPLGYMNDPYGKKGLKEIKPDPECFPLVRRMFDLMLTGNYSVPQIMEIANKEWGFRHPNGKRLARTTLYRTFTLPFYYSMFEFPQGSGNWYEGKHRPMITAEEYDRIQILLGRKGRPRPKSHIFEFTGLLKCGECGSTITAEEKIKRQKNGNVHCYIYYHCTKRLNPRCTQRNTEVKDLHRQITGVIDSLRIPPEFHEWAMKWFRVQHEKESEGRNALLASQQREYTLCVKKLDGLIDMRAAGQITDEEFTAKKSDLTKEKHRLEEFLADTGNRVDRWLEVADDMFTFVRLAKEKFETGSLELKRQILSCLGSKLSLKDRKLTIDLENALLPMRTVAQEVQAVSERLEPLPDPVNKRENERVYARCPVLLRDRDSNPEPTA
ncbi:MAG: recombinase family protein [Patescibacteria group bacterium]